MKYDIQDFGSKSVHLGCGNKYLTGWINVDILDDLECDIYDELNEIEFNEGVIDRVYACHVLEHLHEESVKALIQKIYKWLMPNGKIYIAVPDFDSIHKWYAQTKSLSDIRGLILGGGKDDYDIHKSIYNFEKMSAFLKDAGFESVQKYEWRDFDVGRKNIDDFSQAYLPHLDKKNGMLMSLNVVSQK
ncbi:methyltransferase domain-containing protein [Amylibacter sp.]|nr:methyltransferase domain-containing protein [Amylibacter sp.]MDC3304286.1 methyltransferase domain-containing protein [Amylibacter sp.]